MELALSIHQLTGVPLCRLVEILRKAQPSECGMTAEQFEQEYAAASLLTIGRLRAMGRIVLPCDCGDKSCQGWQSVNKELHIADQLSKAKLKREVHARHWRLLLCRKVGK
jgi:hypothetical protein